jgi:hypothetical protein
MTKEKFKDLIEAPTRVEDFGLKIKIKSVIARTMRLTLQNPELSQDYLDNLPKTVCENVPTTSNE